MRVLMAMSGGVDSSVAAALLLEEGYEVIGATMQIWPSDLPATEEVEGGCCSLGAVEDARAVAGKLGIPYYVLNFQADFQETVIDYFVDEYIRGRTPNPCIVCNHKLKFQKLLEKAMALDAGFLATGHYVRKERDPDSGRWVLKKGLDAAKDQSYALYGLTQAQIARSLFPLGNYTKSFIREKAAQIGLAVAEKPDSQEICFVPDQDYAGFINTYRPGSARPGLIRHVDGRIMGKHQGIIHYTIGQRKGLGIAAGTPLYVTAIDPVANEVIVSENADVFRPRLMADKLNWIAIPGLERPMEMEAKIRYTAKPVPALVKPRDAGMVEVIFQSPQRAITPGQAVVFYQDDLLLGGGTIIAATGE